MWKNRQHRIQSTGRRNHSGRFCQLTLHLPVRRLSRRRGWHPSPPLPPFFLARNLVHRTWRSEGVVFDVGGAIHGGWPNQSVSSQSGQCALTRWNKRPASRLWSAIAFLHGVCSKRWMKICRQPFPCRSTPRILTLPVTRTTDDLASFETKFAPWIRYSYSVHTMRRGQREISRQRVDVSLESCSFVRCSNWKGYECMVKAEQRLNTPAGRSVSAWNVRGESVRGGFINRKGMNLELCCLFVFVRRSFCDVDELLVSMWILLSAEVMQCLSARGWVFRISLSDDCKVFRDCIRFLFVSLMTRCLCANDSSPMNSSRIFVNGLFSELFCTCIKICYFIKVW